MYNPYIMLNDGSAIHKDEIRRIKIDLFSVIGVTNEYQKIIKTFDSEYEASHFLKNLITYGQVNDSDIERFGDEAMKEAINCVNHVVTTKENKTVLRESIENAFSEEFSTLLLSCAIDMLIHKGHFVWCDNGVRSLPVPNKTATQKMFVRLTDYWNSDENEITQDCFNRMLCNFKTLPNYPHGWGIHMANVLRSLCYISFDHTNLPENRRLIFVEGIPETVKDIDDAIMLSAMKLKIEHLLESYHRPRRAVGYWEDD